MNERIKELADKIWAEEYWDNLATDKLLPAQLNKFAQLIVQECIDIAKNWEDQLENDKLVKESNAVGIVGYRIARQFGVKE